jgi:hypothetical protein
MAQGSERGTLWLVGFVLAAVAGATVGVFSCGGGGGGNSGLTAASAIAHIVLGMTVARATFYSPYLDSGQLALTMAMLASLPLVLGLQALALSGRARHHSDGYPPLPTG